MITAEAREKLEILEDAAQKVVDEWKQSSPEPDSLYALECALDDWKELEVELEVEALAGVPEDRLQLDPKKDPIPESLLRI